MFRKTGRSIKGIEEYNYLGVRFLLKEGVDNNLFCFFSSFAKKGEEQSYNYLKSVIEYPKSSFIFFLDSDSPVDDPRGTYFIGDADFSYLSSIKSIVTEVQDTSNGIKNLYYIGSSKGGTGALLAGLALGKGQVIINAPQIRIGDYLTSRNPIAIDCIGLSVSQLNEAVVNSFKFDANQLNIILTCGVRDNKHLYSHLKYLLDHIDTKKFPIRVVPLRGAHDGVVLNDFKRLVKDVMSAQSIEYTVSQILEEVGIYYEIEVLRGLGLASNELQDKEELVLRIQKLLKGKISYVIRDKYNIFVKIKGLYAFSTNVYSYDSRDRIIAKSRSYQEEGHTFHLETTRSYEVQYIKIFIKYRKEVLVIRFEKSELNIIDISSFSELAIQKQEVGKTGELSTPKYLRSLEHLDRTQSVSYDLYVGKYTYQYKKNGLHLMFYAHVKSNSKKITIMLPGAVNRSKTIYNFQRHSWSDDIDGSVISFLDPTVSEQNNITIGWFQGDNGAYAIPILINFIKTILKANGLREEDMTLLGSSAGGFSCLKIADHFPKSRIIVMNPQTRVFNYFSKEYKKLVDYVFTGKTPQQAKDEHNERLTISLDINSREMPILYYQNREDGHHVKHHLTPLLENIDNQSYEVVNGLDEAFVTNKNLKVIYYSDPQSGHSPLSRSDTMNILNVKQ